VHNYDAQQHIAGQIISPLTLRVGQKTKCKQNFMPTVSCILV